MQKYANHLDTRCKVAHQFSAEYFNFNRTNWIFEIWLESRDPTLCQWAILAI